MENEPSVPEQLLDKVDDQASFIRFVEALAAERERAAAEEQSYPQRYIVDGAFNWKNGDISSFLYATLEYFESRPFHKPENEPSWRMFADFLYFGKIYE